MLIVTTDRAPASAAPGSGHRPGALAELMVAAGWSALPARDGDHAAELLAAAPPDLVLLILGGPGRRGLELLTRLRREPSGGRVPIVCVAPDPDDRLTIDAFAGGADDLIASSAPPVELIARLRVRIERPPTDRDQLIEDPITGALTPDAFQEQLVRELERVGRGGRQGALGYVALEELPAIEISHGSRARDEIASQVVDLIQADSRMLDFVGFSEGVIGLLLPGTHRRGAQIRFERLSRLIFEASFTVADQPIRLTPIIGYTETVPDVTVDALEDRARVALNAQAEQRDLYPTRWRPAMSEPGAGRSRLLRGLGGIRTPMQVLVQQALLLGAPLITYLMLAAIGIDVSGAVYLIVLLALLITSAAIVAESVAAIRPAEPPAPPEGERPLATAIIAAYLPNEADTIVTTVEAFLAQDYPKLQVIVAYNTPKRLPIEDELEAIAARDSRLEPLAVEGSVSKAQNVNAALARVRGEFVGMFDADHHPAPGSFERAWRWLASGVGVVQGHCVIRNGDTNFVTRLVAAEFEMIYAVSHPGRARLHGFGIFGGSNGYWRTSLLQRTRMRGFMLTEDIDSSMRVLRSGETIVSDPDLVSTELAPETARALWNQRLRWAQGWSQVSLRYLVANLKDASTGRQRIGVGYLLGWRELSPWLSLQMVPLFLFWVLTGASDLDWFIPIFVATSILTFAAGPVQAWCGWRLAHPSIGRHRRWFAGFLVSSLLFYTEFKNIIARTAQIKELMRDRQWKVTPRSAGQPKATSSKRHDEDRLGPVAAAGPIEPVASEAEADVRAKMLTPHNRRASDRQGADEPIPDGDHHRHEAG